MKPAQILKTLLLCGLLLWETPCTVSASPRCEVPNKTGRHTPDSATEPTRAALEHFYKEYTRWFSASYNEVIEKPALPLSATARRKMEQGSAATGCDLLIRAQDFNKQSLPTLTVTPVTDGWYAVAYLDTCNNRCVVIPIQARMHRGRLEITDLIIP